LLQARIKIAVAPATAYEIHKRLFDMLSAALAVDFAPYDAAGEVLRGLHGLIVLSPEEGLARSAVEHGVACYQVHSSNRRTAIKPAILKFGSSDAIHRAVRGANLTDASLKQYCSIPQALETLAEIDGRPVWSVDASSGRCVHHVGVDLPDFGENDFFQAHFRAARWFAMLPLLHFLRQLLGAKGWKTAEPRATFIIDDPNFHHRSYGYVDFAALIEHAKAHNYHATVATVPLDTWYFNRKVAALFRAHPQQVSVMMHGVNHLADELARPYSEDEALALLAVGLRRIAAFEAESGVKVARIMAAPHGAFKESIAEPMLQLGFEAGCVSVGSLTHWNTGKPWLTDLGIPMAQGLGREAFPVFHRTSTNETDIRLSAFLGHPVVIATHHHDYVSNFARIESLAKLVNEIASPQWVSIKDISRTNYLCSTEQDVLRITPYTRRLKISVSPGTKAVQLMASPFCPEAVIELHEQPAKESLMVDGARLEYSVANNVMELHFPPKHPINYERVARFPLGLWAVTRRLLAEGRDRAVAILSFATAR
jgi:hypothetical protein